MCVYTHIHMCIYIYIYRERERYTHKLNWRGGAVDVCVAPVICSAVKCPRCDAQHSVSGDEKVQASGELPELHSSGRAS